MVRGSFDIIFRYMHSWFCTGPKSECYYCKKIGCKSICYICGRLGYYYMMIENQNLLLRNVDAFKENHQQIAEKECHNDGVFKRNVKSMYFRNSSLIYPEHTIGEDCLDGMDRLPSTEVGTSVESHDGAGKLKRNCFVCACCDCNETKKENAMV